MYIKLLIFVSAIFIYVGLINLVAYAFENPIMIKTNMANETIQSEAVAMGNSAKVIVERNRFYGKIVEKLSEDSKISKLYFLGLIPLPLFVGSTNFKYVHVLFGILIFVLLIALISKRRYDYGDSMVD